MTFINLQTTIFQSSKYYSCPTRVTRLKVAPNMTDSTSIKHSVSSLKTDLVHHVWRDFYLVTHIALPYFLEQ